VVGRADLGVRADLAARDCLLLYDKGDWRRGGPVGLANKGGGPRILLASRVKTVVYLVSALIGPTSDEFWKALPAIFIARLMPGDCWIRYDSIVHTIVFLTVWFWEGLSQSFAAYCHHETCLRVPWLSQRRRIPWWMRSED
jgi:hypothetical protein